MSKGLISTGGSVATAVTPNREASRERGHRDNPATSRAKRESSEWNRDSGRTGAKETLGTSRVSAPRRRRRAAHAETLNPAWIGIEHFELDPRRVGDYLSAFWDTTGEAGNEPAECVDLILFSTRPQLGTLTLFQHFDRGTRVDNQRTIRALD